MIQKQFAEKITKILKDDPSVLGVAAAGSWITNELDDYSDLDLVLVTKEKVSGDKDRMLSYAEKFGKLLAGFTGEHVGEPRVLICLYDEPLLHVDIKFLVPDELDQRIEDPVILMDKEGVLQETFRRSEPKYPYPDYQWIEDRFWIWIHYALAKIGRGEFFEALDFLAYLRMTVLGPLLQVKNGQLPKGVRKLEMQIEPHDLDLIRRTIADYQKQSLLNAVDNSISLYRYLRQHLYKDIALKIDAEQRVIDYFQEVKG